MSFYQNSWYQTGFTLDQSRQIHLIYYTFEHIIQPTLYLDTARWAEAIHHQCPEVEGLLWTSNKCDPDTAYLFFGDRVAATDFDIVAVRDGAADLPFLADVRKAGRRSGITITV